MTTPQPSVGQIVHYRSYGTPPRADGSQAYASCCRAAIVTEVADPATVGLCVFNPEGLFLKGGIVHDETGEVLGTWHWPERV